MSKTGGGSLTGNLFAAKAKPDGYVVPRAGRAEHHHPADRQGRKLQLRQLRLHRPHHGRQLRGGREQGRPVEQPQGNLRPPPRRNPASSCSPARRHLMADLRHAQLVHRHRRSGEAGRIQERRRSGHRRSRRPCRLYDLPLPQNYAPMASADKLKILAIGTKSDVYPNAPTFAEQGYEGNYYGWAGIAAPKGHAQKSSTGSRPFPKKSSRTPNTSRPSRT